jgi:hypothetical protein
MKYANSKHNDKFSSIIFNKGAIMHVFQEN